MLQIGSQEINSTSTGVSCEMSCDISGITVSLIDEAYCKIKATLLKFDATKTVTAIIKASGTANNKLVYAYNILVKLE